MNRIKEKNSGMVGERVSGGVQAVETQNERERFSPVGGGRVKGPHINLKYYA